MNAKSHVLLIIKKLMEIPSYFYLLLIYPNQFMNYSIHCCMQNNVFFAAYYEKIHGRNFLQLEP